MSIRETGTRKQTHRGEGHMTMETETKVTHMDKPRSFKDAANHQKLKG